jgi:DNA-directed RNA polymerase specialized sigma subunit
MDFLYVEHLTWDDTAEKLEISVRTAKRLEEKVIGLLREFLLRERG